MRRSVRNTWILAGVVAFLLLAVFAEQARDRLLEPAPLLNLDRARLQQVTVQCAQCPPRRFQRVHGTWQMLAPWNMPANAAYVNKLVTIADTRIRRRLEPHQIDARAMGFERPFATLELGDRLLEFGTTDAIDQRRYVRMGQQVVLVSDKVSAYLLAPAERFVDNRPAAGLPGGLLRVEEEGSAWPDERTEALRMLTALDVGPVQAPETPGKMLALVDGTGQAHAYRYWIRSGKPLLVRDQPPIAYDLAPESAGLFGSEAPDGR